MHRRQAFWVVIISGALFWLADTVVDSVFFYQGGFWELLILDVPPHEVYVRLTTFVFFALFAAVASILLSRAHRIQRELEETRRYKASIIDSLYESIIVLDPQYRIVDANRRMLEETGIDLRAATGRLCYELLEGFEGPCDSHGRPCPFAEVVATAEPRNHHRIERGPDGRERHLDVLLSPIVDDDKHVRYVIRSARDVSDLFEALQEQEHLARFPEENPEPVLRINDEGRITYANQAARPVINHWGADVGRMLTGEALEQVRRCAEAGDHCFQELHVGDDVYRLRYVPVPGQPYVNIYGRDVTEERALEARLNQSRKMEAIGRLAGGVAHDFNNMLTPILGYAEMLRMQLDGDAADDANQIVAAAQRSRNLVSQLLALGRKSMLQPAHIDLNQTIREARGILDRLLRENIQLRVSTPETPCVVYADTTQIQQVLINLVVNAVDAMSAGGSLIIETASVRLDNTYCSNHAEIEPGRYCMLAVTDTGKGMAPETAEKIFEPFFTTKDNGGSGLGLATVHGIVRQHGGHINVYSEPEKGTCFKIYLPRSPQSAEAETQAGDDSTSLVGGTETILLVEDDTMVRGLAKAALDQLGYTVLPAHDAESAIHIADQHDNDIDLLVTDVVLPGLNGAELHGNLRVARPHLPALFMSGYTGNVVQDHGVIGEGMRFIPKPFTLTELASSVRNALETARSG